MEEGHTPGHLAVPVAFAHRTLGHGLQHDFRHGIQLAMRMQGGDVELGVEEDDGAREPERLREDLQDALREVVDQQGPLAHLIDLLHEKGQLRQVRLGLCRFRHAR
ncbi:hypothetical protein D3C86_1691380 [compost metagenome]